MARPDLDELREKAIDQLSEIFAEDLISVEEFEQRVDGITRAASVAEMRNLLEDLPRPGNKATPSALTTAGTRIAPRAGTAPPELVKDREFVVGVLGGGGRKGQWVPARIIYVGAVLGGAELDFRDALMPAGVIDVKIFTMMGGVEIIVPPDLQVEVAGIGILGGFEKGREVAGVSSPDLPVLRVGGFACMGGAEIKVRLPGETAREAKKRARLARREERRMRKLEGPK